MRKGYAVFSVLFFIMGIALSINAYFANAGRSIDTCPAMVDEALFRLENNCNGLGRNSACYGYNNVYATFNEPVETSFFTQPADRAELVQLQSIQTTALDLDLDQWGLALMNVQANVPGTLPGQGVIYLLLGDAQLENKVEPEEVPTFDEQITVLVGARVSLYTLPTWHSGVLGSTTEWVDLLADARSEDGEWIRVLYDDGSPAWVYTTSIFPSPEVERLPRVNPMRMSPMQAFRFTSGIGAATCEEATGSLIIQGPNNVLVDIEANGAHITIGSTIELELTEGNELQLSTLSGIAYVENIAVPAGYTSQISLDVDGQVTGQWTPAVSMTEVERTRRSLGGAISPSLLHYPIGPTSPQRSSDRNNGQANKNGIILNPVPITPDTNNNAPPPHSNAGGNGNGNDTSDCPGNSCNAPGRGGEGGNNGNGNGPPRCPGNSCNGGTGGNNGNGGNGGNGSQGEQPSDAGNPGNVPPHCPGNNCDVPGWGDPPDCPGNSCNPPGSPNPPPVTNPDDEDIPPDCPGNSCNPPGQGVGNNSDNSDPPTAANPDDEGGQPECPGNSCSAPGRDRSSGQTQYNRNLFVLNFTQPPSYTPSFS